jgi:putative transposase
MPYVKVYIHFVWSTKNREPFLSNKEIRFKVWQHILENARLKGMYIDCISGFNDHCHCLISLGVDQTVNATYQGRIFFLD